TLRNGVQKETRSFAVGTSLVRPGRRVRGFTSDFISYINIPCYFRECCQPDWISFNPKGLEVDLQQRLFGQHLASRIILKAKPLVLSLHGPTGTGKSFVSKMIAHNLYKEGMDSTFVHLLISTVHFPHVSQIETYRSQLRRPKTRHVCSDRMAGDFIDFPKPERVFSSQGCKKIDSKLPLLCVTLWKKYIQNALFECERLC
uniref:Torsin family 1 n=1 Tax=Neogobius melanostomus TaxID=47308 RepID=A0A8C6TD89_9GOBI